MQFGWHDNQIVHNVLHLHINTGTVLRKYTYCCYSNSNSSNCYTSVVIDDDDSNLLL